MDVNTADASPKSSRSAELMLVIGTIVWGSSFTWAKHAGDVINELSGSGRHSAIGPTLLMSVRFFLAGLAWLAMFPRARRGWSRASLRRGLIIGVFMGGGLFVQVLGLDRTSEAVSAFLTSLTILFVPLMLTVGLRQPPRPIFWVGVVLASAGVWFMTGAMPSGFGWGELFGLLCAIAYSVQIILTNRWMPLDDPYRITAMEFLLTGLIGFALCGLLFATDRSLNLTAAVRSLQDRSVLIDLGLLVAGPTLISYGAMSLFQPKVDATRATLIYLLEPIAAAVFAWLEVGRRLGPGELAGGALILSANIVVEVVMSRRRR